MKPIIYKSSDDSVEIKFEFIQKPCLKYTHLGKSWPIHTQCLMYYNGFLKTFATIVKHARDEHNPKFAYRVTAEKCLKELYSKGFRQEIRKVLVRDLDANFGK